MAMNLNNDFCETFDSWSSVQFNLYSLYTIRVSDIRNGTSKAYRPLF